MKYLDKVVKPFSKALSQAEIQKKNIDSKMNENQDLMDAHSKYTENLEILIANLSGNNDELGTEKNKIDDVVMKIKDL